MLPSYKLLSFTSWKHNVCTSPVFPVYILHIFSFCPRWKKDIWKDVTFSLDFTSQVNFKDTPRSWYLDTSEDICSKYFISIFAVPYLFFLWVCNLFLISGYKRQISSRITRLSFVICYLNHTLNQNKIRPANILLIWFKLKSAVFDFYDWYLPYNLFFFREF